jgi:hypothetical protein
MEDPELDFKQPPVSWGYLYVAWLPIGWHC